MSWKLVSFRVFAHLRRDTLADTSVLGFVGSTGSTIISFILPGFFYFKLFRSEKGPVKWLALALGIYGLAVMAFWSASPYLRYERARADWTV
jgi:hypothetical protein